MPEAPNLGSVHLNRRPISLRFLLASCAAEDFKREVRRSFAEFAETHSALTMKQTATAALIFCLLLPSFAQDSDTTFKVNVKLVNVFVTVTDQHGAPIADLKKDKRR